MNTLSMPRRMESCWVDVSPSGYICLTRSIGNAEVIHDEAVIAIHPAQAESVIKLITDAEKEAAGKSPERALEEISVYASQDGMICFARSCEFPENDNEHPDLIIALHPLQVPTVIQWIREVKNELDASFG